MKTEEEKLPVFILKDGRTLSYRSLQKGDEARLAAFNKALSKRSRSFFLPHAYDDESLKKAIRRAENNEDAAFIALDGERVAAYWFLWWFNTDFPVLGIGILDEYHGQGLGSMLMDHLIKLARESGCRAIELTTALDNKAGKALYEKKGFIALGQVDNTSGDGRITKEWHMYYPIESGVIPPPRVHDFPV